MQDDEDILVNQRFLKLTRLKQLGIYVDEAHHSFGDVLAKDMGIKKAKNSLRFTINELAKKLTSAGTKVVGCYNYTGTPYVGNEILPEVVYAYNLKAAIDNEYLKRVNIHGYSNPKTSEFINFTLRDFFGKYSNQRYEGMLPKLDIFASTIEELQNNLRPLVEKTLSNLGIPLSKILINVGDPKHTTNVEIREFNNLDTPRSEKQIILLVNKGREGIFVLQATMRCMRSIGPVQETANVYLSEENMSILDDELQQNFRISSQTLQNSNKNKRTYDVKLIPPQIRIPVKRIRKLYKLEVKSNIKQLDLKLGDIDEEKFKLTHIEQEGLIYSKGLSKVTVEDLTNLKEQREFSALTLVAEIARYLNISCLEIETILKSSLQGIDVVLNIINKYNEVLYEWVIPLLYQSIFIVQEFQNHEEQTLELVKEPKEGYYQLKADEELVAEYTQEKYSENRKKTFHLDTYCFDSKPEKKFFDDILENEDVKEIVK
ncbi:hypothetical protein [Guptibacillus hwajinpoensis]|uniref:Stress response protein YsnF n=1 Tax=Guptibacillus hwajinpoensis TaxID=208199 RepID=A0ABU0JVE1_9BACL|nr:hypothetical protein [Alkalihalobacillus hemicentroti]MDQ0481063.1 stress response protein YsnF [Alkalihalobacillus hemicentroti]